MNQLSHRPTCPNAVGSTFIKIGFRFSVLLVLLLAAFLLQSAVVSAQTVSYTSTIRTLGSGFNTPYGVVVDASGNVYVTDGNNNAVKEIVAVGGVIPANPTIRTIGSGFSSPDGIAIDSSGNLFVADYGNSSVKEIVAVGGVIPDNPTIRTLGTAGGFNRASDVAVDSSGNVYVSVWPGQIVQEILAVGGSIPASSPTVRTLASGHDGTGLALDSSGNLYEAGWSANDVRVLQAVGGTMPASPTIRTLATGLSLPSGVVVDSSGNVYFSTHDDNSIHEMLAVGGVIPASPTILTLSSAFNAPYNLTLDGSGNIYVADTSNNAVKELATGTNFGLVNISSSATLTMNFTFGTGGSIGAPLVTTQGATGLDYTDAGTGTCTSNGTSHVYANGDTCTVVVKFTPKHAGSRYGAVQILSGSTILTTVFVNGIGVAPELAFSPAIATTVGTGLNGPQGVGVDGNGNVFIANTTGNSIIKVTSGGVQSTISTAPYTLSNPGGVAVDGAGNLFIADYSNSRVERVPWNGTSYGAATLVGSGISTPNDVAVDGNGNVYIANEGGGTLLKLPWTGTAYGAQVTVGSGLEPTGVAVDANLNVYVARYYSNVVQKIPWTGSAYGSMVTIGSGLVNPFNVAVDANSNVYIADSGNKRVVVEPWTGTAYGTQTVIANVATNSLTYPSGVSVDGNGNVYIADQLSNRIVKLSNSTGATLTFPTATKIGSSDITDGTMSFTILNVGNAPLTVSVPGSGANPSISGGFVYDVASTCPDVLSSGSVGTILQGGSCTYSVDFIPTAVGTNSGNLILTDNNLNTAGSTQLVPLTGTGLPNVSQLAWGTVPAATISVGGNAGNSITVLEENSSSALVNTATDTITITVTGPSSYSRTYTATAVAGVATFNLCTDALPAAGSYSYVGSLSGVTSTSIATESVNQISPLITWATPASIVYGTALSAVQLNASASVAGTSFVYVPAAGSILTPGAKTLNVTFTPTDTVTYTTANSTVTLNITKATPIATLTASPNPVFYLNPVTLTATLPAVGGGAIPTGTVNFYDGATLLTGSPVTLIAGVATLIFNPQTPGTHTLTAIYNGDSNYLTATSNSVPEVAADFTITAITSPTTILPGGIATYTVTLTPVITNTFPSAITLTYTGTPSSATSSLSATTAAAGAGVTTSTLTVAVPNAILAQNKQTNPWQKFAPVSLALLLLPFLGKARRKLGAATRIAILLVVGFAAVVGMTGCGNNASGYFGQQPKTYIITVTGTAGLLSHSTNVSLTVE